MFAKLHSSIGASVNTPTPHTVWSGMKLLTCCLLTLSAASSLLAGGFWIQLGNPDANPRAKAQHAVLVVQPVGCGKPENAKLTGMAEGLVDGKRSSLPLTLVPLDAPGTYAVPRTWPAEGTWVLSFSGTYESRQTGAIARLDHGAFTREGAQFMQHNPTPEEIGKALGGLEAKM